MKRGLLLTLCILCLLPCLALADGTVLAPLATFPPSGAQPATQPPALQAAPSGSTTQSGYGTAVVHNPDPQDRLYLRKEANVNAVSYGKYYNGTVVTLLSGSQNGWVRAKIGSQEGYMESQYLSTGSVTSAQPVLTVNVAQGKTLTLRADKNTSSSSLGEYGRGKSVTVMGLDDMGSGGIWYHVQVDGKTGFMSAAYLTPTLPYHLPGHDGTPATATAKPGGSGGSSNSGGSGGSSGSGTSGDNAWQGPTGSHIAGSWPLTDSYYLGVVENPNPADRLHLRAKPSSDAASLGKYYNGVRAAINTVDLENGWAEVYIGNLTGYFDLRYFVTEDVGEKRMLDIPSAMPVMVVNNPGAAGNLNLREKQSTTSKSLGLYPNGTQVLLMGFGPEWAHVIVDGKMGFMLGKYLQ